MSTKIDDRQVVNRAALGMVGSAVNDSLDTIFPKIDAEIAKLFEDRNILLTDGGTITFTGTQIQFTENLKITLNQKISGAVPQVISLGSASQNLVSSGDMLIAVINRTAGTGVLSIVTAGNPLPAVTSANQEVFLIAKRVDAGDGTQRLYWRDGFAMNAGQTLRLGQGGGTGTGTGTGDDLDALLYRASFTDLFSESSAQTTSSIDGTAVHTNATYNAAKSLYVMNYDAGRTSTGSSTTTNIFLDAVVSGFTAATGDIILIGGVARKITAVTTQSNFTTEAFPTAPANLTQVTVSQAVHTKDIYNLPVDGVALSAAFGGATFNDILVTYKDNATTNSNLWTPNTTPFVAYTASQDGTSYTTSNVRATNETDTQNDTVLPAFGTGLFLRFFANKTSGAGFVNLLMYKAFMQKTSSQVQGGVSWSSYGTTNNATTPINCTVTVSGGKTTINFTNGNQYATGVNPGQTFGVLDVLVNGQEFPRFVGGSVPTSDGYYTELSATAIQLDQDYSLKAFDVQVLLRTQTVDVSQTNSTNITNIQSAISSGFQPFVNPTDFIMNPTAAAGTPAASTFYSSVVGRSPMMDLSQDLRARMGIERLMTQQIQQLQNEFGPNGELVWSAPNDLFGQIRFIGNWISPIDPGGLRAQSSSGSTTDYVEVTFYGTGLNLLGYQDANVRTAVYAVDGGSESSVSSLPASPSGVISVRNYSQNVTFYVVNGLSLGIHTVKIRNTSAFQLIVSGFEVLNESSSIKVNPGIGYIAGQKLVITSQSAFSYSAPVIGTRGGRVLVYQKPDTTIGTSFQATNGSQANLTSTDHSNEEIARFYNWREFGAGRSDDFSLYSGNGGNLAFTLDDDTTSLVGSGLTYSGGSSITGSIHLNAASSYFVISFVGTGLDIIRQDDRISGSTDTITVSVDGSSIGTLANTATTNKRVTKIVSGLPYGTHNVKIVATTATNWLFGLNSIIVYQPKKPVLPTASVELADYNVMANFAAAASAAIDTISTGTLRKNNIREFIYSGTFSASLAASDIGGWEVASTTTGDFFQYSFFGTGFDWRFSNNTVLANWQITVDGATNLTVSNSSPTAGAGWTGSVATNSSFYGAGVSTFTASTGTLTSSTTATVGNGIYVSGLTLGLHTVKIQKAGGTGTVTNQTLDLITPIHSYKSNLYADLQNTLPVGSNALSDNRKITPVKDILPAIKSWTQAIPVASNPTTTSNIAVPIPDMSCTIKTSSGAIQVSGQLSFVNDQGTGAAVTFLYTFVDGVQKGQPSRIDTPNGASTTCSMSINTIVPVSAGTHKVDLYWSTTAGLLTAISVYRVMQVREI